MNETTQFYYNLTTGAVEEGHQSPGTELMGPYATRAEAEKALETAAGRNREWDEEDREWAGDGEQAGQGDDGR